MVNYQLAKIYQIISEQTELVYVGSTCKKLCQRMSVHRSDYKRYLKGDFRYITSFDILQFEDAKIVLLEEYPCDNKEQLIKKEAEYIREMNCCNKVIPGRTPQEYRIDNKERLQEYLKNNSEKILKKQQEYRKNNSERVLQQRQEWYKNNYEKISQYKQEWYKNNSENISQQGKKKITCECGCEVNQSYLTRHTNSKKT